MNIRSIKTTGGPDGRMHSSAICQTTAQTKTHSTYSSGAIAQLFDMVHHYLGIGIVRLQAFGHFVRIALVATSVVVTQYRAYRIQLMKNLGNQHHKTMPGHDLSAASNGSGLLKNFGIQN